MDTINSPASRVSLLRGFTLKRGAITLLLATLATAIIYPYFDPRQSTFYLVWFRMIVTALTMFIVFTVVNNTAWATRIPQWSRYGSLVVGALMGAVLSGFAIGRTLSEMFTHDAKFLGLIVSAAGAIAVGAIAAMLAMYRERSARAEADLQTKSARADAEHASLERRVLEAQLKLMQAQIEPHFLFNTLANVQHLIETSPPLASRTLESLITYLRAALPQMREDGTTLGREADLVCAYLDIQQLRMGERLKFSVDVPPELRATSFPPMMLMTLVENAIKHGIDPLQQGGEIRVSATQTDKELDVSVADTGSGLAHTGAVGVGIGLQNIRDRLSALFGKRAKLSFEENGSRGVVARITLRHELSGAD
ncbi:MAG: histidine kinase [Usitatibacteraceae bacterium]